MIYRYLHTHLLSEMEIKNVMTTVCYKDNFLYTTYHILDNDFSIDDLNQLLKTSYFTQLLMDTKSYFSNNSSKDQISFSVNIPYLGA